MVSTSRSYSYLAPIVIWTPLRPRANPTVSPVGSPSDIYQAQRLTASLESKFLPVSVTGNILCVLAPTYFSCSHDAFFLPGTSLCICFCLLMRVLLARLSVVRIQIWAQMSLLLRAFVCLLLRNYPTYTHFFLNIRFPGNSLGLEKCHQYKRSLLHCIFID